MPGKKVLSLILARGGSKGVPRKNIAMVAGRPLIAWTIEAALKAKGVDRCLVSTDSEEIAEVARKHGAEAPFLRPPELSNDEATAASGMLHAMDWLEKNENYRPDAVLLLQPTSPLRTSADIDEAIRIFETKQADAVVALTASKSPYWLKTVNSDGTMQDFLSGDLPRGRRQDLAQTYVINGALYLVRNDVFRRIETFYTEKTHAYVMPAERSLDVDTPWDLYLADLLLKARRPG